MDAVAESEQLFLQEEYDGGKIDWQSVFARKREVRNNCRKGIHHPFCKGCWELQEKDWDEEDYISEITFAHIIKCNSRCIYCYIGCDEKLYSSNQEYQMFPIIQDMLEKGLLKFTGSLRYMGGEPTLMSDFEDITNLFVKNNIPEIYLPTSGIKFSKAMEKACKTVPFCQIFISIDSGSKETYKKIKNIDAYEIVLNSLKRYAAQRQIKGHIISKYIMVPPINDNIEEIDKWIKDSKDIGLTDISLDVEYSYVHDPNKEKYLKHLLNLTEFAQKEVNKASLNLNRNVPYMQKLMTWAEKNADKLANDEPKSTVTVDVSKKSKQDVENILQQIIDENSIWNKPEIYLVSDEEITNNPEFDEILYSCYSQGFQTRFRTSAKSLSPKINQAILLHETKII